MLNTFIIYSHLLLTCLALGSVLVADFKIWQNRNNPPNKVAINAILETEKIAIWALVGLWVTGALLIAHGYNTQGIEYVMNEKVWAKVTVVSILTINGYLLHKTCFPVIKQQALMSLKRRTLVFLALFGTISSSAWLFAAFLGIARPWSHHLQYEQMMAFYSAIFVLFFAGGVAVMLLAKKFTNSTHAKSVQPPKSMDDFADTTLLQNK